MTIKTIGPTELDAIREYEGAWMEENAALFPREVRFLAVDEAPDLPRWVWADESLRNEAEAAIACWNRLRPGTFEMSYGPDASGADVAIVPTSTRTFVDFSTAWPRVAVYCGHDLDFWLPHELGHALGLADHVLPGMDTSGYIRPVEASEAYRGVMSYQASHEQWFGDDDVRMMREVFPLPHRVALAQVAT